MNSELVALLKSLRGRRVVALMNKGNRGDGFIHEGGRHLFTQAGLSWQEIWDSGASVSGDALLVFGNGAFCRQWDSMAVKTEALAGAFERIVILPSSFDLTAASVRRFVMSMDCRFTLFCRECRSYDALRKVRPDLAANLFLGSDLAFHFDLTPWKSLPAAGKIAIFREDHESACGRLPRGLPAIDASRGPPGEFALLLETVARHSEIMTDRCHAAIAGALMGRKVLFYAGAYFKNRAIFEHSLQGFPNVGFVSMPSFSVGRFILRGFRIARRSFRRGRIALGRSIRRV